MQTKKQKVKNTTPLIAKQRSYKEITTLLDGQWSESLRSTSSRSMTQLDKALGSPSKKLKVISIGGSNGKSLTINFVTQLLTNEGLKVGSFYSPHFIAYNERIAYNNEQITNNDFADISNEVVNTAASLDINIHAEELLTMTALYYFAQKNIDVAVLEFGHTKNFDATTICTPIISAITRFTDIDEVDQEKVKTCLASFKSIIKKNTWVISADQNKFNLQTIQAMAEEANGKWAMPIRKLANLAYPFEQLHGRCAALAERAAQIFVQEVATSGAIIIQESLLAKPKGQRGRPTLEAKRQSKLNPKKTTEQYWDETLNTLPGRFELIKDTKPMVLLDNASNLDAFKNLLLGVRLLHYDRTLKGLTIIVGCENNNLINTEFYKIIRYFFKKTSGQILFCPVTKDAQNQTEWNVEQITNDTKNVKVKAKSTKTFTQAFDSAKKAVDEHGGLIVITGSRAIISEYWQTKGSKK